MKKTTAIFLALLSLPAFGAVKMKASGQKSPEEVVEKNGVYTVIPQNRTRIQLYPEGGYVSAAENMELEISADVSGSGNVALGLHLYAPPLVWKNSTGSKMIRVDAEETETIKAQLTINCAGINRALPFISVISGEINVENVTVRYKNGLDKTNAATAPIIPKWQYTAANAINCSMKEGALQIMTAGQATEMIAPFKSAKDGDNIQLSGVISGKGKISIGLHLYDKSRTWQGVIRKNIIIDGEVKEFPPLTVATPNGKKAVAAIRTVINIAPNSNVELKNIEVK